jgi:hypothetical protein
MSARREPEAGHVRDKRNGKWWWCHNAVIDQYGPELGPHGLAVYAALCRYANDEGACWPSVSTIGHDTGMSPNRVRRSLADLERCNLISIERRADGEVNLTSIYTLLDVEDATTTRSTTSPQAVPTSPREAPLLHGVKEGTSPREAKEDSKKKTQLEQDSGKRRAASAAPPPLPEPVQFEDIPAAPPKARKTASEPTPQQALVGALAETTGMDPRLNGPRLGRVASKLARVEATPELIQRHYGPGGWWYTYDWRGKQGEFPRPEQVIETWGQWDRAAPLTNGKPNGRPVSKAREELAKAPTLSELRRERERKAEEERRRHYGNSNLDTRDAQHVRRSVAL